MTSRTQRGILVTAIAGLALIAGCSGDLARSSAPVGLVVTNAQNLNRIDLLPGATNCDQDLATVNIRAILLSNQNNANLPVDDRFNTVQLTSYRVSYQRRDGGTLVPAPFTRSISGTIDVGGGDTALNNFLGLQPGAILQAPFAALLPSGGGRDPETGKQFVGMDIILEVFGQTLAGERVSGSTRLSVDFCYSCNGCA
jgi:hypothetical protein